MIYCFLECEMAFILILKQTEVASCFMEAAESDSFNRVKVAIRSSCMVNEQSAKIEYFATSNWHAIDANHFISEGPSSSFLSHYTHLFSFQVITLSEGIFITIVRIEHELLNIPHNTDETVPSSAESNNAIEMSTIVALHLV